MIRRTALILASCAAMLPLPGRTANTIGPQSPVETYDAEVSEPAPARPIDFPALINQPTSSDGVVIVEAIDGLLIEFVGGADGLDKGPFVNYLNRSRVVEDHETLYAMLRDVLSIYRGLPFTIGDLRFIQQDIVGVYRDLGYPLMSVVVPPQEVQNASITVRVNEFRLGNVNVLYGYNGGAYAKDGEHWSSEERIMTAMNRVMDQAVMSEQTLNKEIKRLNRNPFRTVKVAFEPGANVGESVANIQVDENKPWNLRASYNNHATKSSGQHRYQVGGTFGNWPMEDQQLSWNATLGNSRDEFENYSLIYTAPDGFDNTVTLNANYSDTASSNIPGINSASTTLQTTLTYAFPVFTADTWDLKGSVAASVKQFERASLFRAVAVGGATYDAVGLALNSTLSWRDEAITHQLNATLNLTFDGVTSENSTANFRQFYNSLTGEPDYSFVTLSYARVKQTESGLKHETQLSAQIAYDRLAGSDNFAIGGANTLRAYESSEVAGDYGWFWVQLMTLPAFASQNMQAENSLLKQIQFSLFFEYGEAHFIEGSSDSLWDTGLQLSLTLMGNISCQFSAAIAGQETRRTDKGDIRVFSSCSYRY